MSGTGSTLEAHGTGENTYCEHCHQSANDRWHAYNACHDGILDSTSYEWQLKNNLSW